MLAVGLHDVDSIDVAGAALEAGTPPPEQLRRYALAARHQRVLATRVRDGRSRRWRAQTSRYSRGGLIDDARSIRETTAASEERSCRLLVFSRKRLPACGVDCSSRSVTPASADATTTSGPRCAAICSAAAAMARPSASDAPPNFQTSSFTESLLKKIKGPSPLRMMAPCRLVSVDLSHHPQHRAPVVIVVVSVMVMSRAGEKVANMTGT